ncbi:MAG: hypothetical protein QM753_00905 [Thermomicrobiales bacterium]
MKSLIKGTAFSPLAALSSLRALTVAEGIGRQPATPLAVWHEERLVYAVSQPRRNDVEMKILVIELNVDRPPLPPESLRRSRVPERLRQTLQGVVKILEHLLGVGLFVACFVEHDQVHILDAMNSGVAGVRPGQTGVRGFGGEARGVLEEGTDRGGDLGCGVTAILGWLDVAE